MSTESSGNRRVIFGENVRATRETRDLTQTELADKLRDVDMTRDKIAKIERGSRPTSIDEAYALSIALDVQLDELLMEPILFDSLHMLRVQADEALSSFTGATDSIHRFITSSVSLNRHLENVDPPENPKIADTIAWAQNIADDHDLPLALHLAARRYIHHAEGTQPTADQVDAFVRDLLRVDAPGGDVE